MQIFFKTLIQHSKNVTIVPETIEKFKSVSTEHFIFIDSFSFLSSSIEKLVESAKEEGEDCFMLLKKHFPDSKQFQMLLRKGIYFYDYASDFKVFNENKLPSRKNFSTNCKTSTSQKKTICMHKRCTRNSTVSRCWITCNCMSKQTRFYSQIFFKTFEKLPSKRTAWTPYTIYRYPLMVEMQC